MPALPSPVFDKIQRDSADQSIFDGKIDPSSNTPALKHFISDGDTRQSATKRRNITCEVEESGGLALAESRAITHKRITLKALPNSKVEVIAALRSRKNVPKGHDETSEIPRKIVTNKDPSNAGGNVLARPVPCEESIDPGGCRHSPQSFSIQRSEVEHVYIKKIRRDTQEAEILKLVRRYPDLFRNFVKVEDIIDLPDGTWASMELAEGDLGQVLSYSKDRPPVSFKTRLALFEKLLSLADGLRVLHEGMGKKVIVHADFRDQNVLVCIDEGGDVVLKICDFGISFYGHRRSSGAPEFTNPKQGSECDGRPPEGFRLIHKDDRANVSGAYDVYAFGALLCLRLAWLWGGPKAYENFSDMRTNTPFWEPGVNTWFFSIDPESRGPGTDQIIVDPDSLRVRLDTHEGLINVIVQPNRGVRRYFESIRDGEGPEVEKRFIWVAFLIIEKHCLSPNPKRRSRIGIVAGILKSLTSWYRAKK